MQSGHLGRALAAELARHPRWFVLTGAGVSTESGIPAYRDELGEWRHKPPMRYQTFVGSEAAQRRYWSRSVLGYERIRRARPNAAHRALAELEQRGHVGAIVTQNVDDLHRRAGSQRVIDLHGRLSRIVCLDCRWEDSRDVLQRQLTADNPDLSSQRSTPGAPDGDAIVETRAELRLPRCSKCGGTLKPAVVFFGETVPAERVRAAYAELDKADAVLAIGSSLMVFSGYRFVYRAASRRLPIVILNAGRTRADPLATLKLEGPCGPVLEDAVRELS